MIEEQSSVVVLLSRTGLSVRIRKPIVESFVSLSADKKWILHKTVITDIKPVSYMQKVLVGKSKKA